ncbi:MAG: hypothetical protein HOQ18_08595, partial [Dermatophilaceae bacterium]|nr:hypothetical protein [Dermatophilaceae bacterium]
RDEDLQRAAGLSARARRPRDLLRGWAGRDGALRRRVAQARARRGTRRQEGSTDPSGQ